MHNRKYRGSTQGFTYDVERMRPPLLPAEDWTSMVIRELIILMQLQNVTSLCACKLSCLWHVNFNWG